ncbi:MAG: succinate-semialdehyde dehydrogenase [Modestobacter sp.]|jgi:succinate-semialdehyde dehydrogenase/glutarate-semialdehyde dehydrogenase|nr:succinate-semialdehyde dehydrogenase [Modestobacter sp.]
MAALVDDAVERGAEVLTGGGPGEQGGYFWQPTLLSGLDPQSRVMTEEPSGPLALAVPCTGVEDGPAMADALPCGLASYAVTADRATSYAVSEGIADYLFSKPVSEA